MPAHIGAERVTIANRTLASRLFGYDIFISFALGQPPRGTLSYASDLARRLRERDFNVFFSEDEAPPGEQLDNTLRTALLHSKTLVVIANRGTLQEPRWVVKEVEEFRKHHPKRLVVIINVGGALQDPMLNKKAQEWLQYQDKIWIDESEVAVANGIATEQVIERLITAPKRVRSNFKWRWVTRGTFVLLAGLATGLGIVAKMAINSDDRAHGELKHSVSLRLISDAQSMLSGTSQGGDERALLLSLAARRIATRPETDGWVLNVLFERKSLVKLMPTGIEVGAVAFNPNGRTIVTGSWDNTLRLWDVDTGQPIGAPLQGHTDSVRSVVFSPDGTLIVSGSGDKTLRLWNAPKAWPDELCKKLTRNMSHKQWREWVSPEIDYRVQCPGLPIQPE